MGKVLNLLTNATTTVTGSVVEPLDETSPSRNIQVSGTTSSGGGSASVVVEVSNDRSNWMPFGTIALTLSTTSTSDGIVMDARWPFVRARVAAISGTGASVSATMGV
jgi:hypothetical protein